MIGVRAYSRQGVPGAMQRAKAALLPPTRIADQEEKDEQSGPLRTVG